jgi:hypothetical protein
MPTLIIIALTIVSLSWFIIACIQRLEIFELRHELHEIKRWNRHQEKTFWDEH